MIKITETVRNLMKFDSKPTSTSNFVEEKLGVIDYDFAVGISKELNRSNISAKKHSTNNNVEALYDGAKELLDDALKGVNKYLKGWMLS